MIQQPKPEQVQKIQQSVLSGETSISSLDLTQEANRQGLLGALKVNHMLVEGLNIDGNDLKEVVVRWIEGEPQNFKYLTLDQYYEGAAAAFLNGHLDNTNASQYDSGSSAKDAYSKSLDGRPLLQIAYVTRKNQEIEYYDHELEIPTWLKAEIRVKIKINNAVKLIRAMDVTIEDLNATMILNKARRLIMNSFRNVITDYVFNKRIGFYQFSAAYSAIADALLAKLEPLFNEIGATVISCYIDSLTIPEQIRDAVREQAFLTKKMNVKREADKAYAEESLVQFEKKAAVMQKFNLTEGLTELEKDLALERHIKKMRAELTEHTYTGETLGEIVEVVGKRAAPPKPGQRPVKPADPSADKQSLYFTGGGGLGVLLGIFLTTVENILGILVIVAGLGALTFGITKLLAAKKKKDEYAKELNVYEAELSAWEKKNNEYRRWLNETSDKVKAAPASYDE
jgi:regulator of protease activity HflC (stomatin/prohibitin superfamily)